MQFLSFRSGWGLALALFFLWLILVTGAPDLIDALVYWLSDGALQ